MNNFKFRYKLCFMALLLIMAASVANFASSPVSADPWGTNTSDTGAHPDADPHTWCFGSVSSGAEPNIKLAESEALEPTAANAEFKSTCNLYGPGETDVVWNTGNLSGTVRGQTICEDFDNSHCDQFYVYLDLAEINEGSDDEYDQNKTACHELGHTAGLSHGSADPDCMISGERPSTASNWGRYGTHHKAHIANWF